MPLEREPFGEKLVEPARAAVNVEESIADRAVEVVVVRFGDAREFVAIAAPGHQHRRDFTGLLKSTHGAIHRSQAQGLHGFQGQFVDLRNGEWSSGLGDDGSDCLELSCGSSFGHGSLLGSVRGRCGMASYLNHG